MANNLGVSTGSDATVKTTDVAGVHTPHHIVDQLSGPLPDTATNDLAAMVTALGNILTALGGALDVSGATVAVSGVITANAGSNLNTSALALESGGNLAGLVSRLGSLTEAANPAVDTTSASLLGIAKQLSSSLQALENVIADGGQTTAALSAPVVIANDRMNGSTAVATMTVPTGALDAGDVAADTQTISAIFNADDIGASVTSVTVIDPDAQDAELYILFLSTATSIGTENSAPSITDANLITALEKVVHISSTDYVSTTLSASSSVATVDTQFPITPISGTDDYALAVICVGTPTFAGGAITIKLGLLHD